MSRRPAFLSFPCRRRRRLDALLRPFLPPVPHHQFPPLLFLLLSSTSSMLPTQRRPPALARLPALRRRWGRLRQRRLHHVLRQQPDQRRACRYVPEQRALQLHRHHN